MDSIRGYLAEVDFKLGAERAQATRAAREQGARAGGGGDEEEKGGEFHDEASFQVGPV